MPDKPGIKKVPPLPVIRATGALRNFILRIGTRMFPPEYVMMEIASSVWLGKAVSVATELGIAELLQEKPLHITDLALRTGMHEHSLLRLMRLLSGYSVFKNIGNHTYANNKLSKVLLEESRTLKKYIQHHIGRDTWSFIGDMEQCIRQGENAIRIKTGMEPFDYLKHHPEQNETFSRAMTDTSEMAAPLFLRAYPFGRYRNIVDIGGGHGYLISAVAAKYKGVECMVVDQPHVVAQAAENFKRFGVEDRCSFKEGDFFGDIPKGGDLYILKNVLHDWDDERCILILKNIVRSMHSGSRLLVIESLVDDRNRPGFAKIVDLQMLVGTSGGNERTREQYSLLFAIAGLELIRAINTATPFYFIECKGK